MLCDWPASWRSERSQGLFSFSFSLYTLNYLQHISALNQHQETCTIISFQKTICYCRCISIHLLNAQIAFHSASETAPPPSGINTSFSVWLHIYCTNHLLSRLTQSSVSVSQHSSLFLIMRQSGHVFNKLVVNLINQLSSSSWCCCFRGENWWLQVRNAFFFLRPSEIKDSLLKVCKGKVEVEAAALSKTGGASVVTRNKLVSSM